MVPASRPAASYNWSTANWTMLLDRGCCKKTVMAVSTVVVLAMMVVGSWQVSPPCKNCVPISKEHRAMFVAHNDACAAQSGVTSDQLSRLLGGAILDAPELRKHVYCVLLKCKVISKDGKLLKSAVINKMAARAESRNATKALEECFNQYGDTPEDLAWNLFRCGYEKKTLFDVLMLKNGPSGGDAYRGRR